MENKEQRAVVCPTCEAPIVGVVYSGAQTGGVDRSPDRQKLGPQPGDVGICSGCYEPFAFVLSTVKIDPDDPIRDDAKFEEARQRIIRMDTAIKLRDKYRDN